MLSEQLQEDIKMAISRLQQLEEMTQGSIEEIRCKTAEERTKIQQTICQLMDGCLTRLLEHEILEERIEEVTSTIEGSLMDIMATDTAIESEDGLSELDDEEVVDLRSIQATYECAFTIRKALEEMICI